MIPMRKSPEIQTKFGKCDDDFISNCATAVIYGGISFQEYQEIAIFSN